MKNQSFSICNMNGKIIYKGISNGDNTPINIPEIANGIYYVQVISQNQLNQKKFMIYKSRE